MRDQVTAIVSPTTTNGLMSPCQRSRWWNPHAWRSSFYSFTHSWTYLCSSFLLIRLIALAQLAFQPCADALLLLTDEERQLNWKYPLPGKAEAANSLQTDSFPCWKDKCHRKENAIEGPKIMHVSPSCRECARHLQPDHSSSPHSLQLGLRVYPATLWPWENQEPELHRVHPVPAGTRRDTRTSAVVQGFM